MCLGVPAEIIEIKDGENGLKIARVRMGAIVKEVILGVIGEEVKPGDYVIVHAGIAISKISQEELSEILEIWNQIV